MAPSDSSVHSFALVATRPRHDGWTAARQRGFILLLRETGTVTTAARMVGLTTRSAYRLRDRPGAAGFAAAWDRALTQHRDPGFERSSAAVLFRRLIPLFFGGRLTGAPGGDDAATLAALGGGGTPGKGDK